MSNIFQPLAAVAINITGCLDGAGIPLAVPPGLPRPAWTSSDPAVLPITAAQDGMSAIGTSLKAGTVTVTVTSAPTSGLITGSAVITFAAADVPVTFVLNVAQLGAPPPPPPAP
jgi:hypothetical protein